jgi:hypothetical protein
VQETREGDLVPCLCGKYSRLADISEPNRSGTQEPGCSTDINADKLSRSDPNGWSKADQQVALCAKWSVFYWVWTKMRWAWKE